MIPPQNTTNLKMQGKAEGGKNGNTKLEIN